MKTFISCLCCAWLFITHLAAQNNNANQPIPSGEDYFYWKILSKVKFLSNFDKSTGEVIYQPVFGKDIENLEGKKIFLKGYIIPADLSGGKMTLSAFPYTSCYFCGGAGPESVVEIDAKEPIIYRMEKPLVLEGTLELNRDNPLRLMYVLRKAGYHETEE